MASESPSASSRATPSLDDDDYAGRPFTMISKDDHRVAFPYPYWRFCNMLKVTSVLDECGSQIQSKFSHECLTLICKYLGWFATLPIAQQQKRTSATQRAVCSVTIEKEFKHPEERKLAQELEDSGILNEVFEAVRWLDFMPMLNFVRRILAVLQVWIEYKSIKHVEWHTPPRDAGDVSVSAVKLKNGNVEVRRKSAVRAKVHARKRRLGLAIG